MSFNIASDGSPTPRKGPTRFPVPGDLRIDTSPEALGQAVGNLSLGGYPYALQRMFGSALTSNTQGFKRSLGPSALGNRSLLEPPNPLDVYKVCGAHTGPLAHQLVLIDLMYAEIQHGSR